MRTDRERKEKPEGYMTVCPSTHASLSLAAAQGTRKEWP